MLEFWELLKEGEIGGIQNVLNPLTLRMAQYTCSHLYLMPPCPGPSAMLSLELELPVLWMGWGSLRGGRGSCLATWSHGEDLGISFLNRLTQILLSLTLTLIYRDTWCSQFWSLLGVLQGKLGFSWFFPLSA